MFAKYHYLSHSHNNAARVFLAFVNDQLAGFCSVLHFPHPKAKNIKKIHRLVVLPDYQGASFGLRFLNEIAKHIREAGNRAIIATSSPSLVFGLKAQAAWRCLRYGRVSEATNGVLQGTTSKGRVTTSWEYQG
jgi:GNAT superfamily N-acetyltransferase